MPVDLPRPSPAAAASEGAELPRIVIVGDPSQRIWELAHRLAPFTIAVIDPSPSASAAHDVGGPWDILVVGISGISLAALEWSLARWPALGRPEMVFVSRNAPGDPLDSGLDAAGIRYLMGADLAPEWLLEHAHVLAEFARARRAFCDATLRLPKVPVAATAMQHGEPVALYQAEQCFRAAYVKVLLASSPSRQEAARKARVAYRTFCHILEKLGISSRKLTGRIAGAQRPAV
jgi:hypothetical protein